MEKQQELREKGARKDGPAEGAGKEKKAAAKRMLLDGLAVELIAKFTDLDV
ncbi:hypothetical protein [Bacillus benzoevorans]|uniref:Uncharacterized protein n=1 Tax=Bacillus benzoevorans TaxID=1456 RepID=A0A7X0HUV3_9BACI|nr:hypothetical protein [Bacillus benzoevorans]MBB6447307.1 hypothetical protein [Bacillus benzoevorans]